MASTCTNLKLLLAAPDQHTAVGAAPEVGDLILPVYFHVRVCLSDGSGLVRFPKNTARPRRGQLLAARRRAGISSAEPGRSTPLSLEEPCESDRRRRDLRPLF